MFRLVRRMGVSQREIGRRTGQSQSEVSEIVRGRQVRDVTVLERICDGLEVPRGYMRLAGGAEGGAGAYAGGGAAVPEEVAEAMRRRVLLEAGISVVAAQVPRLDGLPRPPDPAPVLLPSRIDGIHVAQVRNLTRRLGEAGNPAFTHPEVISAATGWANRLLGVPGAEPVKRALRVAVAELHIEAGWAGFDAGCSDRALHHFTAALVLAAEAGDVYLQSTALNYAGLAISEHGRPNDGLKMLQLAMLTARGIPRDEQRAVVVGEPGRAGVGAQAQANAASALADLGDLDGIVLATVYVQAGEPGGFPLAHDAITAVSKLSSVRVRKKLEPLAVALTARPGRDARDLARMARQTVTARA
ncbi:MAG: helix-turn-helix transcriptional regulator [Pseudonocardiaceae bacterium]